jgi:hypothetical protein
MLQKKEYIQKITQQNTEDKHHMSSINPSLPWNAPPQNYRTFFKRKKWELVFLFRTDGGS